MAYRLTAFDGVNLTNYNVVQDLSPAEAQLNEIPLAGGGAFDGDGTSRARAAYPRDVAYTAELVGSDFEDLRAQFDALAGLTRRVGLLERTASDTGEVQTCMARLAKMPTQRQVRQGLRMPVGLTWRVWGPWNGARTHLSAIWDGGYVWDDVPSGWLWDGGREWLLTPEMQQIDLYNGGNTAVRDIVLEVEAPEGTSPVTAVYFNVAGVVDLKWSGTLDPERTLITDCGAMACVIEFKGAQSAQTLTRGSYSGNHTIAEWLRLEPGVTPFFCWIEGAEGVHAIFRARYQYAFE